MPEQDASSPSREYIWVPCAEPSDTLAHYLDHGFVHAGRFGHMQDVRPLPDAAALAHEWDIPTGLALVSGGGHTWIALDMRGDPHDPPVVYVVPIDRILIRVADSIAQFWDSLVPFEALFDHDGDFIGHRHIGGRAHQVEARW